MLHCPVVPECHCVCRPCEAALVLWGVGLPTEPVDQVTAFVAVHTINVADEGSVDVEVPLSCEWMRADDGMSNWRVLQLCLLALFP